SSMRKRIAILGLPLMTLLFSSWPARACGDKLLILGRGVRFLVDTADYPARILMYVNPASLGSEPFEDAQLQLIVEKACHRLRSVKRKEALVSALKTGRYDLVLADFSDAAGLEEIVQSAPSRPMLLPWLYKATPAEKSRAEQRYQLFLKAPSSVGHFLSTVDRTMERKAKVARLGNKDGSKQVSLLR